MSEAKLATSLPDQQLTCIVFAWEVQLNHRELSGLVIRCDMMAFLRWPFGL